MAVAGQKEIVLSAGGVQTCLSIGSSGNRPQRKVPRRGGRRGGPLVGRRGWRIAFVGLNGANRHRVGRATRISCRKPRNPPPGGGPRNPLSAHGMHSSVAIVTELGRK